ncbi:MAG: hypothetical protein NC930_02285 [Candidatus Omnitrophica bacterium]|nr:hypothetical protein [Candidatus Omnitrophota bacterium]
MLRPVRRFNGLFWILVTCFLTVLPFGAWAEETVEFKKNQSGLYKDIFDQNIYYEFTHYLNLDYLCRALFMKKVRAQNVNCYDEVPDSTFFTNRHGRKKLSLAELESGHRETPGPDLGANLTIVDGKFEGVHPGFFVLDRRGDKYLLKFDPVDYIEQATSSEVIGSRFYHAIGYNVPQYDIIVFDASKLVIGENATIVDDSGFRRKLTPEKLEEYLLFIPQDSEGRYRASASKILNGVNKGSFSFYGRRKNDPNDRVDHRNRREIRALQVFSSWISNYDIRESNTLDMLEVDENGNSVLRHYLIDFNTSLGAGTSDGKPPMTTHEYLLDYGEAIKAFLTLGWWEKPWQKRWREVGEKVPQPPAVGYFDNRYFDPGRFKVQLPHHPLKDLTRADGFWAAKIIMAFSDEDIKAMVGAGKLTDPKDSAYLVDALKERRHLIAKYWFDQANPLDAFDLKGNILSFNDLAIEYGFQPGQGSVYNADVFQKNGEGIKKLTTLKAQEPAIDLKNWLTENGVVELLIRTTRPGSAKQSPSVRIQVSLKGIERIIHED